MKQYKKILILNLIPNTIGDNVMLTPVFRIIKKNLPKCTLHVTVSPLNSVLFENNPNLDRIIAVDELRYIADSRLSRLKKAYYYLRMMRNLIAQLRKEKYDLCFVMLPNFAPSQLIPWFAGIKERVGYTYERSVFAGCLNRTIEYETLEVILKKYYKIQNGKKVGRIPQHFIDYYFDILKALSFKFNKGDYYTECFTINDSGEVAKMLQKFKIHGPYVLFQTCGKANYWDKNHFASLGTELIRTYGVKIILAGTKSQVEYNSQINKLAEGNFIDLTNKTTMKEIMAIIKNAKIVIAVNSGLMHLAAALYTPLIGIFGPQPPEYSGSFGKNKVCNIYFNINCNPALSCLTCKNPFTCSTKITPKMVLEYVKQMEVLNP